MQATGDKLGAIVFQGSNQGPVITAADQFIKASEAGNGDKFAVFLS